jgi:hypothetical protein
MKNEKWLIYVIIGFTSITTILLLSDGSPLGFFRAILGAAILDGLIVYWDAKRVTLKSDTQRGISGKMMWAGVGIMLTFALGYGIEIFSPVEAIRDVDVLGYTFTLPLKEFIVMSAVTMIGAWVVLTLGMVLYMRGIDPDVQKDLDKVKSNEEAENERNREEAFAYSVAMKVTARTVGTEKALRAFRENLENMNFYTPHQIDLMVDRAKVDIEASITGGIPVDTPVNTYQSETVNPTQPSTPRS